jgi:hypothetical protein
MFMKEKIRHIVFNQLRIIALLLVLTVQQAAEAQSSSDESTQLPRIALRTNLLYDATLSPNLGIDVRVDSAWTVGLLTGINAWDIDKTENKKWRHALFSLRARKYRDSLFHKGYFEGDLIYSHFNVGNTKIPFGIYKGVQDRRLQGDLVALGGKYGYSWILARHWRIEAEAGVAVGYAWFKEYDCDHCGTYYGKGDRIFLLPQLGINVVYIIN